MPGAAPISLVSSTYAGSSSSVFALKYALLMSIIRSCVLFSLVGSQHGWSLFPPSNFVVTMLKTILKDSSGGVGAKIAS